MTKLLLEPKNNLELVEKFDGIILGLKGYSIGYEIEMSLDDIELFKKNHFDKSVFVVMNKNIMNEELSDVESILRRLESISIEGVFFYDLSILYIKQKYNLSIDLVWNQTHMVTNYNTCNYYYEEGCKYAYLSQEITLDEMLEITDKSCIRTIVKVFGHPVIAHSKRALLTNYFKHINKQKTKDNYLIKENNLKKEYIVKETKNGTTVFGGNLINGIKPSVDLNNKIDYFILEEQPINFMKVVDIFIKVLNNSIDLDSASKELKVYYPDATEGFFYTKTIYRVKNDETN